MMPPLERFRFHSEQEPEEQTLVRIPQAVKRVLLVQGVQAVGNFLVFAVPGQVIVAMLVMGTWNYFHSSPHTSQQVFVKAYSFTAPLSCDTICFCCPLQSPLGRPL